MKIIKEEDSNVWSYRKFVFQNSIEENFDISNPYDKAVYEKIRELEDKEKALVEEYEIEKQKGYDEGMKRGYVDSYNAFLSKNKKESERIQQEKDTLIKTVDNEVVEYINKKRKEILDLVCSTVENVLFNTVKREDVFKEYFKQLHSYVCSNYDNVRTQINQSTYSVISNEIKNIDAIFEINNSVGDYDFLFVTDTENVEIYMTEIFRKIKEIFSE